MDALKSKGQMLDQINLEQIPRSGFDLSYSTKGTGKIGRIIPTRCMECLPSDSIKGSSQAALQFQPLAVPILANMRVKQETWYVPNHILLDNWDTFITKGQDLSDNSVLPSFSLQRVVSIFGSLLNGMFSVWCGPMSVYSYRDYMDKAVSSGTSTATPLWYTKDYSCFLDIDSAIALLPMVKQIFKQGIFAKYEIDDLFDYVDTVCESFEQYLADIPDAECYVVKTQGPQSVISVSKKVIPLFKMYATEEKRTSTADVPADKYYHDVMRVPTTKSGKNWSQMSYYEQMFWQPNTAGQYAMPIATDYLNRFMQFLYDLCAPVFGLGSNMDYLGYKVMSPIEFYYCIENCLKSQYLYNVRSDGSSDDGKPLGTKKEVYIGGSFIAGIVSSSASTYQQNVLPLRACYSIWYNNYRDKLLELKAPEPSTATTITDDELLILVCPRIRAWSKDSFNTSLANTGTGSMVVPITGSAFDYSVPNTSCYAGTGTEAQQLDLNLNSFQLADGTNIDLPTRYLTNNHSKYNDSDWPGYAFSLDTLRRAGRTEKWIQKALIYGNLIQDALFTHWGVKIKNERIQLPEFVTSSVELVKIDTILNNTTTAESIAGDKAGFASVYDNGTSFDWYSPENGYLISFMTVLPEQTYPAGMPRHLCKLRIFDYAFPEFAQIGMDAVYNDEVQSAVLEEQKSFGVGIFGYQGRYYDYKCKQDEEHGSLRDTDDMYTFARTYNLFDTASRPKLNYRFVHCHPSLDMFVMDDPSQDQFRYDVHHSVAASRALPVCGMSV